MPLAILVSTLVEASAWLGSVRGGQYVDERRGTSIKTLILAVGSAYTIGSGTFSRTPAAVAGLAEHS